MKSAIAIGLIPVAAFAAAMQGPAVKIVAPTTETVLFGTNEFVVEIDPPSAAVQELIVYVDGRQICRFEARPFRCTWDAGRRYSARTVRVAARFTDGTRQVQNVRTRALDLAHVSGVDAVMVFVHVTDNRGSFVTGLQLPQFRLLEDGVPQRVTALIAEDSSVNVLLALDTSGSMAPAMADLRAAAASFLGALRPQDQATLAAFSQGLHVIAPPAADAGARAAALSGLRAGGGTALFDSIIRGAELIKSQPSPRAMVVFTDGDDVSSLATLDAVRTAVQGADVLLYIVAQGKADRDAELRKRLDAVARETGGAAYFASRMSQVREHFADIVRDIANQYVLVYTPARELGDGAWRSIKVELTDERRRLAIKSRQGYFAVQRGGF